MFLPICECPFRLGPSLGAPVATVPPAAAVAAPPVSPSTFLTTVVLLSCPACSVGDLAAFAALASSEVGLYELAPDPILVTYVLGDRARGRILAAS